MQRDCEHHSFLPEVALVMDQEWSSRDLSQSVHLLVRGSRPLDFRVPLSRPPKACRISHFLTQPRPPELLAKPALRAFFFHVWRPSFRETHVAAEGPAIQRRNIRTNML